MIDASDCFVVGGQKREAPTEGVTESPKRGREDVVTLTAIQAMLKQQTDEIKRQSEELRRAQLQDLKDIAKNLEQTTKRQVDEIRQEVTQVRKELGDQGGQFKDIQAHVQKLEHRLLLVENRSLSSAAASTASTEPDRALSVMVGGWPSDTRRDDLLGYGKSALQRLDALKYLDAELFTTGLRRGYLLSNLKIRTEENQESARQRMMEFVKTVNEAQYKAEGMQPSGKLWASKSRGKAEREKGAHAGKIRKIFHQAAPQLVPSLECEYSSGTVFYQALTVGSAAMMRPDRGKIAAGRGPGFWVDLAGIAKATSKSVDEVEQLWKAAIAN